MLYFEDFLVGQSRSAGVHELVAEDIVAFARQWDPQPWHVDPVAAEQSPMQGLTASSCHTYSIAALLLNRMEPAAGIASLKHEIGLPNPARPGDRLTLTMTCVEKRASASRPDRGLIAFDGVLANQSGLPVLTLRSLMMIKTRPAAQAGDAQESSRPGSSNSPAARIVTLEQAAALGSPPPGNLATPVFDHGSLEVEWYAPLHEDRQTPHDRDEVYVVARGDAVCFDGEQRTQVTAGTFIFVAAGREHRFEKMSADFAVWVLFYGPTGGE